MALFGLLGLLLGCAFAYAGIAFINADLWWPWAMSAWSTEARVAAFVCLVFTSFWFAGALLD